MATRRLATVFGGTGFIGQHIVSRLARLDYEVRVVTRHAEAVRPLMTQGNVGQVVAFRASLSDDAALARAVEGAGLVVNAIGILAEPRSGDFQRLQGELPGRIGRAAAAAGVPKLVHLSAIGADPASASGYARSKAAGEAGLQAAFPRAIILRPSVVFGPEDHFFNRFAGMAQLLPFMPVVSGATRFQPVFVGDVAAAALAAARRASAEGQVFELGGPRVASFRELMGYVLEVTGRPKRLVELPPGLVRLQARLGEFLPNPPLTRDQLILLQKDNVVSPGAKGFAELGIAPQAMEAVVPSYLTRFRPGGGRRAAYPA
ncbi:complex I NDUFA9 subunit family protein [Pseudoroseomonas deserti]|uniref:Complex I NDUFA9 subunit family protein n=1 Tax=Teichococcus deserti TaxID=1817963 RepID=A0A1V2H8Q0_9PROT|nr:complex I NDUFA9 subunit family protein [Pseudoroseomonas deserti]ONG58991.1 complex I NDUFA9 subunit family protein [Pseudoroseomonas deserti]